MNRAAALARLVLLVIALLSLAPAAATAAAADQTLTVTRTGPGTGTGTGGGAGGGGTGGSVTSSPAGITCPTTCSKRYADQATVTLTAVANTGYRFRGFTGVDTCATVTTCELTMDAARTAGATFGPLAPPAKVDEQQEPVVDRPVTQGVGTPAPDFRGVVTETPPVAVSAPFAMSIAGVLTRSLPTARRRACERTYARSSSRVREGIAPR